MYAFYFSTIRMIYQSILVVKVYSQPKSFSSFGPSGETSGAPACLLCLSCCLGLHSLFVLVTIIIRTESTVSENTKCYLVIGTHIKRKASNETPALQRREFISLTVVSTGVKQISMI